MRSSCRRPPRPARRAARGRRAAVPRRRRRARRPARPAAQGLRRRGVRPAGGPPRGACSQRTGGSTRSARPSASTSCRGVEGVDGRARRRPAAARLEGRPRPPRHRGRGRPGPARSRRPRAAATSRSTRCSSTRRRASSSTPGAAGATSTRGVLRAVDARTFGEDPLRALRAVQLAARYELAGRPGDRRALRGDAARRAAGRARLRRDREAAAEGAAALARPRAARASGGCCRSSRPSSCRSRTTPQDPEWHPEGDVWTHTLQVVDEARAARSTSLERDRPRQLAVMLGALCHDLGKPTTTRFEDGRIRSRGHEEAGLPPTDVAPRPLERPHAPRLRRARRRCWPSSRSTSSPASSTTSASACRDGAIRRLAAQVRARPALPRGAGRLPRPPAGRLRARGDGVVPRARAGSSTWRAAPAGAAPQGPRRPRARRVAPGPQVGRVAARRLRAAARRRRDDARGGARGGPSHPRTRPL